MRLELEGPFKGKWKLAYLIKGSDNRKRVFLYNSRSDRAGLSYARYLMCVHLNRMLKPEEHVDHVDEDKTNDVIGNLQILTPAENTRKNVEARRKLGKLLTDFFIFDCPVCKEFFTKRLNVVAKLEAEGRQICCSKSCSAKLQVRLGKSAITKIVRKKVLSPEHCALILELRSEGKSDYTISDMTGISRAKIQRYRTEEGIP